MEVKVVGRLEVTVGPAEVGEDSRGGGGGVEEEEEEVGWVTVGIGD